MTDRRYGVNKYGDGRLYGPSTADEVLAWDVSVDWDNDGIYEVNEANRLIGMPRMFRGRDRLIMPKGKGFEPVKTGTMTLTLDNHDGRYDGWNTSSPLYPNVTYDKYIRVRVKDRNTSVIYNVFTGKIVDIAPMNSGTNPRVNIYVSDGIDYLTNNVGRVDIQQDVTPDEAMALVLDACNWPSFWGRNIEAAADNIPYWWSSGNSSAMEEIKDLAVSFLGYFFIDNTGRASFKKRTSLTSPTAIFDQEELLKDISNPQPYEIRRNVTRIKVHPRTSSAGVIIFQLLGNVPSIMTGAGNELELFANYVYNNQPVPATNVAVNTFTVNAQPDGSGANLTASCTLTLTDFGDTAKVRILNSSGSTGYLTALKLEGDAIHEVNTSDVTYPKDSSTVTNPRELIFDLVWQQDINIAVDLATVLGQFYANLHPMPSIRIEGRPDLQFSFDLFDIVSLDVPKLGLNGVSFRVGGIEHTSLLENCQSISTIVHLEPYVSASGFMIWDASSEWGTETVFGY